ncbi:hypothetical protein MJO28_014533 [Puccinia striiformis f. sp. tritici]|uniref:Uncharacterized protein n=1 Tax=Puccinia striiformis f. sp. tritici TaxID=168172 RepID=A0ACC0DV95_9BASI|nr:hypothetical protein MJO28_014533 [Puccinia striiformis f. sp. tritici]KAI7939666.1 hypothetical protein MJO29_014402 [Puccinia striiformis f. sp. tritici]
MKSFIRARRDTPPSYRDPVATESFITYGFRFEVRSNICINRPDPSATHPVSLLPIRSQQLHHFQLPVRGQVEYIYKSSRHLGDPSGLTAAGVTLVERRYDFSALDDH